MQPNPGTHVVQQPVEQPADDMDIPQDQDDSPDPTDFIEIGDNIRQYRQRATKARMRAIVKSSAKNYSGTPPNPSLPVTHIISENAMHEDCANTLWKLKPTYLKGAKGKNRL